MGTVSRLTTTTTRLWHERHCSPSPHHTLHTDHRKSGLFTEPGEEPHEPQGELNSGQMYWYWKQTAPALGAGEVVVVVVVVGDGDVPVLQVTVLVRGAVGVLADDRSLLHGGGRTQTPPSALEQKPDQHHLREGELGHRSLHWQTGRFIFYGWRMTEVETKKAGFGFLHNSEKCRLVRRGGAAAGRTKEV